MNDELPGLSIKIGIDNTGVDKGLANTESKLKNFRKGINETSAKLLKYGAAAGVAGAALSVHIVKESAAAAKELQNLARVSNASISDFQKYAFAAKTVGIEQDKMADILKDVNDRVGDFLITGGGPMLDFFETIAPKVGVTIDQFKGLSGPDALGLYVKTLEQANVSQAQFTFFMEAMASDSTLLLPLLKNNSEELKKQAERAEKLGLVMSDIDNAKLVETGDKLQTLTAIFDALAKKISVEALPAFNDLIDELTDPETVKTASQLGVALVQSMAWAIKAMKGAVNVARFLGEELASISVGISPDDVVRLEKDAEKIRNILSKDGFIEKGERIRFFGPDGLIEYLDDEELKAKLSELDSAIDAYYSQSKRPMIEVDLKQPDAISLDNFIENTNKPTRIDTKEDQEKIQALIDRGKTEQEIREEQYEQEKAFLAKKYSDGIEKDSEYYAMKRAIDGSYMADKAALEQQQKDLEAQTNAQRLAGVAGMFNNLSSLMNSGSKKQFEIGKKAALAGALVSGYSAAVSSYAAGAKIGGPPVGAAFAAASLVATNAQIQAIRSQSFGGGSGGGASGAVTAGSSGALGETSQQQAAPQQITIAGLDPNSLVSGSMVNNLIDSINSAQRDGKRIVITGGA